LIEGTAPDLFLVDISMPDMNGWQLATKLREIGQMAPVVMLSANIGDGVASVPEDAGHNDAIAKPVDIRRLADKLASHLGLKWVYETDAPPPPPPEVGKPVKSPGSTHVQDLLRLGEIGYVRGIEAKLADLAADESHRPFAEELGTFVKAFDMAGYMKYLTQMETEETQDG
jgi:hypothetical protein